MADPAGLYASDSGGTRELARTAGGRISLFTSVGREIVWSQGGTSHSDELR
jgi:hypothetical protein